MDIKEKIKQLGENQGWNHLYVFDGIKTRKPINSPGCNLRKWERLKKTFDEFPLSGKKVLDVGCSDGYFSLMMARLGADFVLGIEPDLDRVKKANFAKDYYCSVYEEAKNTEFLPTNVYDLDITEKYDLSVALGFLHRIPDIYKALENLANVSNAILLEYKTLDDKRPVCLWGGGEVKLNKLNQLYFIPSVSCVEGMMLDFNFKPIYTDKDKGSHLNYKRTIQLFVKRGSCE